MSDIKKSLVIMYIEFHRPQKIEDLEKILRKLVKDKKFPSFATLIPMVDHKGLKQHSDYIRRRDIPFATPPNTFSRGRYDKLIEKEQPK